jgi:hypothetical protein
MQHTHFGSVTHALASFLAIAMVGTGWRLAAFHGVRSRRPLIRGLARMMLFQY